MIKFLPRIYPDESVHSYLCRIYSHSGYIWHIGFATEVFAIGHEAPEYNFINPLNPCFRETLEAQIPYEVLLMEHTLFPYYARFLPPDKRKAAYSYAVSNKPCLHKYLAIPNGKSEYYLRYCPKCVEEDRARYGECYFHVSHLIPHIHVCPLHACELVNTSIPNTKTKNTILIPLEQIIAAEGIQETEELAADDIRIRVARYIHETLALPFQPKTETPIGDYLADKLKDEYLSPRGEQRNLTEIDRDMGIFYRGLDHYDITKQRLAAVFRNLSLHAYDISLIAMFEGITPQELCARSDYTEPRHVTFDRRVRELRAEGKSYQEIGEIMCVCHEAVRQILSGKYDRVKRSTAYRSQKWDWETIEARCCREFPLKVLGIPPMKVNKRTIAEILGLRDKSLRNLPRLKKMISDYKISAKLDEADKKL